MAPEIERRIREHFVQAGFARAADRLFHLVRSSIAIDSKRCPETESRPSASRLCGMSGLPVGIAWPSRAGRPMRFLAQFDLIELSCFDEEHLLPSTGMLFFFTDSMWIPTEYAASSEVRVIYYEGERSNCAWRDEFIPSVRPWWRFWDRGEPKEYGCDLLLATNYRLPLIESWLLDDLYDAIGGADPEGRYFELANGFSFVVPDLPDPGHFMLGNPHIVQMQECIDYPPSNLPAPIGATKPCDWEALLQLTWDFQANVGWGDGFLTFWILREDLKARRFDRVVAQNVYT